MSDLPAAFALQPGLDLSPGWLDWLSAVLAEDTACVSAAPPADWGQALPLLGAHGLAPLLYSRLRNCSASLPPTLLAALAEAWRASAVRSLRMEIELGRLLDGLAAAGVPCLLLKGAALGRLVYASPAERPVSDLDLLVPRAGLAPAAAVLARLGYRLPGPSARGPIGRWFYRWRAELPAVGRSSENRGLLVELHWSLVELPYYMVRIDMAEAWQQARPLPGLPAALAPDPAVLLLHACAHLALHHSRDPRLIWLVDVDRLARSELDWGRVLRLAQAWGLGLAVAACLSAAGHWLATPIPGSVFAALAALPADPVAAAMWGLGDEKLPGRWWRRAWATWAAFDARQRVRYAGWLALRTVYRPLEWIGRSGRLWPN